MLRGVLWGLFSICGAIYLGTVILLLGHNHIQLPGETSSALSYRSSQETAEKLLPILLELISLPSFRYFRVNVNKPCQFFNGENVCTKPSNCELHCPCAKDELPPSFLEEDRRFIESNRFSSYHLFEFVKPFEDEGLRHDWSFDFPSSEDIYADLIVDKEQFTDYQGQNIWNAIYNENCVNFYRQCNNNTMMFQVISGMHTSVSSHLSEYFIDYARNLTAPNPELYFEKVGRFPDRIANLHFAWEIVVRAFIRYHDVVSATPIKTHDLTVDLRTQNLIRGLYGALEHVGDTHFSLKELFGPEDSTSKTETAFLSYFQNITRVMDCVDCKKCKVYGKMQILGLGVAIRILLNPDDRKLTRNELVALVNTLAKWTESLRVLEAMKKRIVGENLEKTWFVSAVFGIVALLFGFLLSWNFRLKREKLE